jgi:hypothetical protein
MAEKINLKLECVWVGSEHGSEAKCASVAFAEGECLNCRWRGRQPRRYLTNDPIAQCSVKLHLKYC